MKYVVIMGQPDTGICTVVPKEDGDTRIYMAMRHGDGWNLHQRAGGGRGNYGDAIYIPGEDLER